MESFTFDAIGTRWEIETRSILTDDIRQKIVVLAEEFDSVYSRFREDSLISRVASSRQGGVFTLPEQALPLFELYDKLYKVTNGAVDPLVGRCLELLGYDKSYRLTPTPQRYHAAQSDDYKYNWDKDIVRDGLTISTIKPVVIDFGAAGKGYLVDLIYRVLHEAGYREFIVDGSGDIRHSGSQGIQIGLEHPFKADHVIGITPLKEAALCASALNRRVWGYGLHHILDARTGVPVTDVIATWVTAGDAITADGLATALFFITPEKLAKEFDFTGVRMFANGEVEVSSDFIGELFI